MENLSGPDNAGEGPRHDPGGDQGGDPRGDPRGDPGGDPRGDPRGDPGAKPGGEHSEEELTRRIERRAVAMGLDIFGVCAAGGVDGFEAYEKWADAGMAGEMGYLTREPLKRSDPRQVMPECRSVIAAGMLYRSPEPDSGPEPLTGVIARYARGDDYHDLLKERLMLLLEAVREEAAQPVRGRVYVDTGPLLERDLAYAAGIGWRAKNTCLIHPQLGSYFFLGEILIDLELRPSSPLPYRCGSCRRCLDACPTRAFVGPGVLDARRCISYLTIELKGSIPRDLRPLIGNMVFGCDICQEVCPWNRRAPAGREPAFGAREGLDAPCLIDLLEITQAEFSERFRGSAIKRTRRRGLARNAAVALGNSGDPAAVPPLIRAMNHDEPLVRGHAAWALGRLGGLEAAAALRNRLDTEKDPAAADEIRLALQEIEDAG